MARNVVHLLASDRRRVDELFTRSLHGRGARKRCRCELVSHLNAHLQAICTEIHAFVLLRSPESRPAVDALSRSCAELCRLASGFPASAPDPAAYDGALGVLRDRYDVHVRRVEDLLRAASAGVEVSRLRELGGAYSRRRDAHLRSRTSPAGRVPRRLDVPKAALYEQARKAGIPGRSAMSREELIAALTGRAASTSPRAR